MNLIKYFLPVTFIFILFSSCEIENNPVQVISLIASDSVISQGSSVTLICVAEDGDGDKLRYSWKSALGTVVSGNKDSAVWTAPEENGYHTITCKVSDENGSSDALGISIMVVSNRVPIAYDSTAQTPGNVDYNGSLYAYDIDGDLLTYTIVESPTNGNVNITNENTGSFTYSPSIGYFGEDSFTFIASDGSLNSNEASIYITVLEPLNNPPVANDDNFEIVTGIEYSGNLSANDMDGDPLSYSIITFPDNGILNIVDETTGLFTYTSSNGYVGEDSFTFIASDGSLNSNEAVVNINVTGILGTIQGTVTNALNGTSISDVTVIINNLEAITDDNGMYTIYTELINGDYQVNTSSESFCPYLGFFEIPANYELANYTYNFSLSPIPEAGQIRMVLNWGELPSDLDSHLKTPEIEGQEHHIYFANRGSSDSAPYATLDWDVVSGYGPETMTINQSFSGNYIYYIYQYSSLGSLNESEGTIQIYNSPDCQGETIYAPTEGSGRYWYVCDIDGETGEITVINQLQDSEPTQ